MKAKLIAFLGESPNNFLMFNPKVTITDPSVKPIVFLSEAFKRYKRTSSGMSKLMEEHPLYNFGESTRISERQLQDLVNADNVDDNNIELLVRQIERSLLKERIEDAVATFRSDFDTKLGDWVVVAYKGSAKLGTQTVFPCFHPSGTSNEKLVSVADRLISKRWNVKTLRIDEALSAVVNKELAVEVFKEIETHYALAVRDAVQA